MQPSDLTEPGTAITSATFYFDPVCPWTWRTSRWLVDTAQRRGIDVSYRAFDLSDGKPLDELPEQSRAAFASGRRFLRCVAAAGADGRDDLIAGAYSLYGARAFDEGIEPSPDLVEKCWREVGGDAYVEALDDDSWDATLAQSTERARELAGDDAGSPVTVVTTASAERAFFGPVVAPTPTGDSADRLWDLLTSAANAPEFFELKARRTAAPVDA